MNRDNDIKVLGEVVGHIFSKDRAIDGTPIYTFILTKNIPAGMAIRFDFDENKITVVSVTNNA